MLLLTSELSGVGHLVAARWQGEVSDTDDAAGLAEETHMPSLVWIAGRLALIIWALSEAFPLPWP